MFDFCSLFFIIISMLCDGLIMLGFVSWGDKMVGKLPPVRGLGLAGELGPKGCHN